MQAHEFSVEFRPAPKLLSINTKTKMCRAYRGRLRTHYGELDRLPDPTEAEALRLTPGSLLNQIRSRYAGAPA